jgi:pimeloyl-ACP methyl ester carboxylesterase
MTTWLLLRGLAREARHWGPFPALLQERLPRGDRVLALDLPGNGLRWQAASPSEVDGMVDAARADLRALTAGAPCMLVALSLGGMVALQWAARFPAEVQGCVLINSSAAAFSPLRQRLRPGCYPQLLHWVLPGIPALRRERAVWRMTSQLAPDPRLLEDWVRYAQSAPVRTGNLVRQLLAAARFRAPRELPVPALVLASAGDRLVSSRCSAAMARAFQLPLRVHPTAGHDLPLDDPAWVAEEVVAWHAPRRPTEGALSSNNPGIIEI